MLLDEGIHGANNIRWCVSREQTTMLCTGIAEPALQINNVSRPMSVLVVFISKHMGLSRRYLYVCKTGQTQPETICLNVEWALRYDSHMYMRKYVF